MEHHRHDTAQSGLNDLKEQIALEYGRCLLQLQQFELMLKAALPTLKVSGFSDELARNVERDCSGQLNPDTQLSRFSASAGGIPSLC